MKHWIPFLLIFFFTATSCNKNQRQVKRIDGKWNVVEATMNGNGTSDPDLIYEFEYCKLRKNDDCEFSIHNFTTDDVTSGVYRVEDGGNSLILTVSSAFGTTSRRYSIVRSSFGKLILENDQLPNGEFSRIVLRKVR